MVAELNNCINHSHILYSLDLVQLINVLRVTQKRIGLMPIHYLFKRFKTCQQNLVYSYLHHSLDAVKILTDSGSFLMQL